MISTDSLITTVAGTEKDISLCLMLNTETDMTKQEYYNQLISLYSIANSGLFKVDDTEDKISALWKQMKEDLGVFEFVEVWETMVNLKRKMGWR